MSRGIIEIFIIIIHIMIIKNILTTAHIGFATLVRKNKNILTVSKNEQIRKNTNVREMLITFSCHTQRSYN